LFCTYRRYNRLQKNDHNEDHNKNLRILFERFRQVGLKLQLDKCEYLRPKLEYLGHIISEYGIKPNPNRTEKVKNYPVPKKLNNS